MTYFSEACERNKEPILCVLRQWFADRREVLEIGSGTGQHALFFAEQLPHLRWLPSEHPTGLAPLRENLSGVVLRNLAEPLALDVTARAWPAHSVDALFTANTLHIISWEAVECLFTGIGDVLEEGGLLAVYGPFRYRGDYTSASNADFDRWLQERDPLSGIRDFEAVDRLARSQHLRLVADQAMPANNQLIVWKRVGMLN